MAGTVNLPIVGKTSTDVVWIAALAGTGALGYALWKKNQENQAATAAAQQQAATAAQNQYAYGSSASPEYGYGYNYGYGAFNAGEEAADYYAYGYAEGLNANTGSTSTGGGQNSTTPANSEPQNQTGTVTAKNGTKSVSIPVQSNNAGDTWYAVTAPKISPATQVARVTSSAGGSAQVATQNGGLTWSFLK